MVIVGATGPYIGPSIGPYETLYGPKICSIHGVGPARENTRQSRYDLGRP